MCDAIVHLVSAIWRVLVRRTVSMNDLASGPSSCRLELSSGEVVYARERPAAG